ncbi:MAG: hypothetical protein AVDCRST_MAG77-5539 [uncultured Chloroflexi bacterium]|uniref:Uncharacterized protein n=1 Tax=uncultured Chloroflexota bacterium TaxID=166587 RepID=A0A6J4KAS9_9CHLR|nr:MAG: hypothetical protein AVDCRST_MAG77-5539 [uncultured Chloroflexota bacterium]
MATNDNKIHRVASARTHGSPTSCCCSTDATRISYGITAQ